MKDVWLVTNWQAIQWVRDPTPASRLGSFQPFQCEYSVSNYFLKDICGINNVLHYRAVLRDATIQKYAIYGTNLA